MGKICVLFFCAAVCAQDCQDSRQRGTFAAAAGHSSKAWFACGVASGVFGAGLIGTGLITGASALSNPRPEHVPKTALPECYIEGYSDRARAKNIRSAFSGGLVGTAVLVTVASIIIVQSLEFDFNFNMM